jgi:DNA repair protein RadC
MVMSSRKQHLRENVQLYGIESLSDADLLTLVVGKGTATEHEKALMRVRTLLVERGGLMGVRNTEIGEMLQYEFDEGSAIRLHALLEVARRLMRPPLGTYQIKSADDAVQVVGPDMRYLDHEEMRVLVLNTKNCVVANIRLYQGTVNSSVLRNAEIFLPAITRKCPCIIICHNHPSNDPTPSPEDIEVTKQLTQAGELLDIEVLDHIIIGNPQYVSLKEQLRW